MNKLLGKIYGLKETNKGFNVLYGLEPVCGGRVAERLERWICNSEAPSSSPAPDVSNFELDLFSVVPSSNPPPSGSEKIAPSWAPMRLKI